MTDCGWVFYIIENGGRTYAGVDARMHRDEGVISAQFKQLVVVDAPTPSAPPQLRWKPGNCATAGIDPRVIQDEFNKVYLADDEQWCAL